MPELTLGDLAQVLVEDDDRVPLGLLAPLARRLVAPAIARRDAQVGDGAPVLGAADLGILAEVADEDHLVDGTSHVELLRSAAAALAGRKSCPGKAPSSPPQP